MKPIRYPNHLSAVHAMKADSFGMVVVDLTLPIDGKIELIKTACVLQKNARIIAIGKALYLEKAESFPNCLLYFEIHDFMQYMGVNALNENNRTRLDRLSEIGRTFDLEIIYAFGSHAADALKWLNDEQFSFSISSSSDLDIGIKPSMDKTFSVKQKVRLAMILEDLFCVTGVDLVNLQETDPFLAANIVRGERLFSRNAHLADEYDLYVLRRAGDLIPLERERIALIMGEQNESE